MREFGRKIPLLCVCSFSRFPGHDQNIKKAKQHRWKKERIFRAATFDDNSFGFLSLRFSHPPRRYFAKSTWKIRPGKQLLFFQIW